MSLIQAQVPDDLSLLNQFEVQTEDYLRNASFNRNYGIAIERLHAGSYSFGHYVQIDALQQQDVSTHIHIF